MKNITSVLTTLIAAIALWGCEQAMVDSEMEKMCKQDGGIKVYETANLRKEQFKYGVPDFLQGASPLQTYKGQRISRLGGGYVVVYMVENFRSAKPTLTKTTYSVIREKDEKTLGTYVTYLRIGGELLPRLGPDDARSCPVNEDENVFINSVFIKNN